MTPFLFIVGCARSGTTLLRLMFDAHPDITISRESDFIPLLAGQFAVEPGTRFPVAAFVDAVMSQPKVARWGVDHAAVLEHVSADAPTTYPEAIRSVYRFLAARDGKQRYGDKTPIYVRKLDALAFMFPEGRFIHLIRDGRDVARSFLTTDMGPNKIDPAIRLWRTSVEEGQASGARLGPGRYTEVLYERLVSDPEGELRRLTAFADLDYSEAMLRYHETPFHGRNHRDLVRPPTPNLRDWRTQLTPKQIATCEKRAGQLLADLGYPAADLSTVKS